MSGLQAVLPNAEVLPLHGISQPVEVKQPVTEIKQEYQPIAKRVDGLDQYKEVSRILSQRLWIC